MKDLAWVRALGYWEKSKGLDGNIWDLKRNGLGHTAQANEHLHLDTTRQSHGNVRHDQAGGRKGKGKEAQYCAAQHVNSNSNSPKMLYQCGQGDNQHAAHKQSVSQSAPDAGECHWDHLDIG